MTSGARPAILATVYLAILLLLMAVPLGVATAVYLEEYAHDSWLTRLIRTNIRNLAGVPAIVYGLLGLALFVSTLGLGKSLVAGGLTLGVLVLPIAVITTSEALRAVPNSIGTSRLRRMANPSMATPATWMLTSKSIRFAIASCTPLTR